MSENKYLEIVKKDNWEYVKRIKATGAVVIVPILLNPKPHLLLIRQFRIPLNKYVIEFPAGLVGDHDNSEDIFSAARREMVEETGYSPGSLRLLIENAPSSSGLTDEMFTLMLAADLIKVSNGGGNVDEGEKITSELVDLENVFKYIHERKNMGDLITPKLYMALFFLQGFGYNINFPFQKF